MHNFIIWKTKTEPRDEIKNSLSPTPLQILFQNPASKLGDEDSHLHEEGNGSVASHPPPQFNQNPFSNTTSVARATTNSANRPVPSSTILIFPHEKAGSTASPFSQTLPPVTSADQSFPLSPIHPSPVLFANVPNLQESPKKEGKVNMSSAILREERRKRSYRQSTATEMQPPPSSDSKDTKKFSPPKKKRKLNPQEKEKQTSNRFGNPPMRNNAALSNRELEKSKLRDGQTQPPGTCGARNLAITQTKRKGQGNVQSKRKDGEVGLQRYRNALLYRVLCPPPSPHLPSFVQLQYTKNIQKFHPEPPQEMKTEVDSWFSLFHKKSKKNQLEDEPVVPVHPTYNVCPLQLPDFQRLEPGMLLTDETINLYGKMLGHKSSERISALDKSVENSDGRSQKKAEKSGKSHRISSMKEAMATIKSTPAAVKRSAHSSCIIMSSFFYSLLFDNGEYSYKKVRNSGKRVQFFTILSLYCFECVFFTCFAG